MEFSWNQLPKIRRIFLVKVVPTNFYKSFFNHAVSYIYTTSGSLSFKCRFCLPKRFQGSLHAHQFPLSSSLNHIVLGEAFSDISYNITHDFEYCQLTLQTNTDLFNIFCPHSHVFLETSCCEFGLKISYQYKL